jgi:glycine dehydrogenase
MNKQRSKNAPHTLNMLTADTWFTPYKRKAAYPLDYVADNKFCAMFVV